MCPLCAKAIKLSPDQDANAAFEEHVSKEVTKDQGCGIHTLWPTMQFAAE